MTTIRVGVVIYPGFDELDAVAPYEILKKAELAAGGRLSVSLVALEAGPITGSQGLTVQATHALTSPDPTSSEAARPFDWLIVAGGSWAARADIGAWGEIQRGELPRCLATHARAGTAMASVCTGAMLLSAAGLTRGRRAVTHHVANEALRSEGANVINARVVDDGDLITAGGVTSGLDLGLWFVERFLGAELAARIAGTMEYTRVGEVARRDEAPGADRATGAAASEQASTSHGDFLAPTQAPPYYAVIFSRVRRTNPEDGYAAVAARMIELAAQQPGYLGAESVADEASGQGITVSYWRSTEDIAAWKAHGEHQAAQARGKQHFYEDYDLRVSRVERAYGRPRGL